MAQLYDITLNREITHLVSISTSQNVNRVINQALDGTTYIQVIGSPTRSHSLDVYVTDDEKAKMEQAEADCNLLSATVDAGTFYGRITSQSFKKIAGGRWHQATVVLASEEVTT